MNSEENKRLVLEHYESFVHKQDAEAVRKQLAPDFRDNEMPPETPPGPEPVLQYGAMLHKAFPDLRIEIEDIVAEGDRVAVRARWTGTHQSLSIQRLALATGTIGRDTNKRTRRRRKRDPFRPVASPSQRLRSPCRKISRTLIFSFG